MKKSIKYAGIAAATLLAVAPVAAPVVSSTTSVQAAEAGVTDDNITTAVKALQGVLTDTTFGDNNTNGAYPTALTSAQYDTYMSAADFMALPIMGSKALSTANMNVLAQANANAQVKVSAVDANGNKINSGDYAKLAASVASDNGSIKYAYTIKYNNTDGDAQTPVTGTFTLTNDNVVSAVKSLAVTYTNPLEVAYGSKTVNASLSSTIDAKVTDKNGNAVELDSDQASAGALYKSFAGAIAADATDVYSDSTFGDEDKTYYQPVTIAIKSGKLGTNDAKTIVDNYIAGQDDYSVTVNGSALSAVANGTLEATAATATDADPANAGTLTFIREVHVSQNASWTTEDVSGVVTTKADSSYYTLKNDDNNTITNRALAKNTAWVTDKVRTDNNGNKQYRVATGEWIDADDVTFSDKATTDEGEYTDVQALNGKVTLDGPSSFVYFLYDNNGGQIANRALTGDSAWFTDKKATNAAGVTVYHVATGEWVQAGSGVNYSAY